MNYLDISEKQWSLLNIFEQMANIGSEVERAISWKEKNNHNAAKAANERALKLFELTLKDKRHGSGKKEIAFAKTLWVDFFSGKNDYKQTKGQWQKYFLEFGIAARNKSK